MVWDYLFDNEYKQRRDIQMLKAQVADAGSTQSAAWQQQRDLAAMSQRLARLELTVEALVRLLQVRTGLSRDELGLMIQRVDLADGVQDGQIGPDRIGDAPPCANCGRPLNPKRETCLYCDAPVAEAIKEHVAPPPRLVRCVRCNAEIPEQSSYFSEDGIVCQKCFY